MRHLFLGIGFGFPLCCVLRWTVEHWFGDKGQAKRRGMRRTAHGAYVPCGVFHKHEFTYAQWDGFCRDCA